MKPKLFLSYGHDDNTPIVRRIHGGLVRDGYSVWIDKANTRTGDDWHYSIADGILESIGVLAFLSKHSVRDPGVCRDESCCYAATVPTTP